MGAQADGPLHELNPDQCRGDGVCVEVCSKMVLEIAAGKARTVRGREVHCISCAQCVAACPTGALSMPRFGAETFVDKPKAPASHEALEGLMLARRSTRAFKDQAVDRSALDRVLHAAAMAPMAFHPPTTGVLVFDRRSEIERLLQDVRAAYAKLIRIYDTPLLGRRVIRLRRGAEALHALDVHVMKIVRDNNAAWDRSKLDRYTYGAPALMLFHGSRWAVAAQENAMLCATYAMLAAQASGLGTTMLSILGPALNNFPDNRRKWGLGDDDRVYVGLILGYPKVKYARAIQRELAGIRYV